MRLYVGNLSKEVGDSQLHDMFVPFGTPESAKVAVRSAGGESRGFGFVDLADSTQAQAAIAGLDGKEFDGKALKVNEARPKNAPLSPVSR